MIRMLTEYDVAIIGGGLAGLAAAITLSRLGHSVVLFEKETYPYHKVCGEYVSMESRHFLETLGVPLNDLDLPVINKLHLTAVNGKTFSTTLPLGGFGISRFLLDKTLADAALAAGVHLFQNTKVDNITTGNSFTIHFQGQAIIATVCCAAYGKRSNIDVKWKRNFLNNQANRLSNYVGVKYHVRTSGDENTIGLHNFKNGYCGLSKIEGDKYCLCYMTRAENLKKYNGNISQMEKALLSQNPHLEKIFSGVEVLPGFPVTISQISFNSKSRVENGVLMLGDAAGMITPLCGNGMSIAMHTAKIAAALIDDFFSNRISKEQLESEYERMWKKQFSSRLRAGRILQSFFGSTTLSNLFVNSFRAFPFLAKPLIKQTHGRPF